LERISIRYRKRVGCSEVAFAAKIVALVAKWLSLPNCAACNESVFATGFYNRPSLAKMTQMLKCLPK
jgi:hypothetical protein